MPAFDVKRGEGALQDLNIYNIHLEVGLFGRPKETHYFPNITNHVDTSGTLILNYEDKVVTATAGKDIYSVLSGASIIEGETGYIRIDSPTNELQNIKLVTESSNKVSDFSGHRMLPEFITFERSIRLNDYSFMETMLQHSLNVLEVLESAKQDL